MVFCPTKWDPLHAKHLPSFEFLGVLGHSLTITCLKLEPLFTLWLEGINTYLTKFICFMIAISLCPQASTNELHCFYFIDLLSSREKLQLSHGCFRYCTGSKQFYGVGSTKTLVIAQIYMYDEQQPPSPSQGDSGAIGCWWWYRCCQSGWLWCLRANTCHEPSWQLGLIKICSLCIKFYNMLIVPPLARLTQNAGFWTQ